MSSNDDIGIADVLCWIFWAGMGIGLGFTWGQDRLQNNLIEQGYAIYYLDEDNERQWRMKECE